MYEEFQPGIDIPALPACPHFGGDMHELPRRYYDGQSVPFRKDGHIYQGFPTGQDFSMVSYITTNGRALDSPEFQYNENLAVRHMVQTFHPIPPHIPTDGSRHRWVSVGGLDRIFGSASALIHEEVPYQYFELGTLEPVYQWVPFAVQDAYFSCTGEYFSTGAFSYQYETGKAMIVLYPRPEILYWHAISTVKAVPGSAPTIGALLLFCVSMAASSVSRLRRQHADKIVFDTPASSPTSGNVTDE